MANTDRAYGFLATPLLRARPYSVDASNGTAIFINDVVMMETDGNTAPATAGNTALLGSSLDFLAASTAGTLAYADHPDQEFHAQDDGVGTTIAQTELGTNFDHIAGTGSTWTRLSGHEIDANTTSTTAAGFRLLDLVTNTNNAIGANGDYRVVCVEHHLQSPTNAI